MMFGQKKAQDSEREQGVIEATRWMGRLLTQSGQYPISQLAKRNMRVNSILVNAFLLQEY